MQGVFNAVGRFFTDLFKVFTDALKFIIDIFVQIFVDIKELIMDIVLGFFDQGLKLVIYILGSIDVPTVPDYMTSLPSEVLNIMGLIGVGESLGLVGAALIVRFFLQLVPMTRLGS